MQLIEYRAIPAHSTKKPENRKNKNRLIFSKNYKKVKSLKKKKLKKHISLCGLKIQKKVKKIFTKKTYLKNLDEKPKHSKKKRSNRYLRKTNNFSRHSKNKKTPVKTQAHILFNYRSTIKQLEYQLEDYILNKLKFIGKVKLVFAGKAFYNVLTMRREFRKNKYFFAL
jgi:hypothetical protein